MIAFTFGSFIIRKLNNLRNVGPHFVGWDDYEFSRAEINAFNECEFESFYFRALPLSIIMGVGTYILVRKKVLSMNKIWGPTPKVILASLVGYFIGKQSYAEKCMQKFMAIPDSEIGEMLRRAKIKSQHK